MSAFLEPLYSRDLPKRRRTVPMGVICLGISRSGTESLKQALETLGYKTYHGWDVASNPESYEQWVRLARKKWRISEIPGESNITAQDFDNIIGDYQAVTDSIGAIFAEELISAYPDAKIVLNHRVDVDKWYSSMLNTFGRMMPTGYFDWLLAHFDAHVYWRFRLFQELFGQFWYTNFEKTGKWRYRAHVNEMRGLVPKESLLEWTVEDGWEPLCKFLDKPKPKNIEFPRGNVPADFLAKAAAFQKTRRRAAYRNLTLACSVAIALVALPLVDWTQVGSAAVRLGRN